MFNVRRNQVVDLHLQFSSATPLARFPLARLKSNFTFWIWLDSNAHKYLRKIAGQFFEVFIAFEFVSQNFWKACGNWNNQKMIVFARVEFPFSVWQWEIQVDEDKALKITWSRTIQDNITNLSKISLTVMWRVCHYDQEKLSWRKSIEILPQWNPSCFIFKSYHA